MKTISQVIAQLQAVQAEHGDIPFVRYQQSTGGTCDEFGHDPDIDIVVEPYQETDSVGLRPHRRPVAPPAVPADCRGHAGLRGQRPVMETSTMETHHESMLRLYDNAFDEAYYERCNSETVLACQALQAALGFGSMRDAFDSMRREEQVACIYRLAVALEG